MTEGLLLTLLGAAIGWTVSQFRIVFSENANLIDAHLIDLQTFGECIQGYWLCAPATQNEELIFAAKVRARQAPLSTFYGDAAKYMSLSRVRKYQLMQLRLLETATGGSFETSGRKVDPVRAIESHVIISEMSHLLRLARREQFTGLILEI